jgi:DNA primase
MEGDQVEEVKSKTDIVSLISEYINLNRAGRHFKALCPFHNERTPSFVVSPELQIFKCFGCGESGDVYTFLEKYEGMEFGEALKFLADRAGVTLKHVYDRRTSDKEKLYKINLLAAKFYNYVLLNTKGGKVGLNYLKKERGIGDLSIKEFFLGFAPNLNSLLFEYLTKKKKFSAYDLEQAGLVIRAGSRYLDRFRGRIIFPIYDARGNCVALSGRILPQYDTGKVGKYINSPETAVYHKRETLYGLSVTRGDIKRAKLAIVTEGEFDLISSWQAGVRNVVAIKGSSLTEDQAKVLSRICSDVVMAFDSDIAGNAATIRGIGVISDMGIDIKVARLTKYKDPDEAVRSDPDYYKKALEKAIGIWDFIFLSVFASEDVETGTGKTKLSRKLIPILAEIPDKIVQAHYIKRISKRLDVPEETVGEQLSNYITSHKPIQLAESEVKEFESFSRREMLEQRLLSLVFAGDAYRILDKEYKKLLKMPVDLRIYEELEAFSKLNKEFDLAKFSRGLPKELLSTLTNLVMKEQDRREAGQLEKEIGQVKAEIERFDIKERRNALAKKIGELEAKGMSTIKDVQEFNILTKKLKGLDLG